MPLPGDRITLSVAPTIQIADYKYIKPHAAITRDLSDDVEGDLARMDSELRRLIARSVLVELNLSTDLYDALNEGGVDGLAAFCQKELGYVTKAKAPTSTLGQFEAPGKGNTASKEAPRKKGPTRKG